MNEFKKLLQELLLEKKNQGGRFCPVLINPEPDCYSYDLNSQKISYLLAYCQDNYQSCDIYQRVKKRGDL